MSKINHVATRIRSPRKRAAVDRAFHAADQHFLKPIEMFRVITEREEPVVMMTWNEFASIIWQLYADLERQIHQPGVVERRREPAEKE